ncbi:hypothetical protein MRX96_015878 [Rhipicephalus microplus]
MSAPLEALESVLEMLIEDCRQLGIIVSDFQSESQTTLDQKINHICSTTLTMEGNPQQCTKDYLEEALTKNMQVKGKIESYRRFKALLLEELTKVFPTEMAKYKTIRGDEPPAT